MLDKSCDASRLVDALVRKDFVERSIAEFDRRSCDVVINLNGLKVLEQIDKRLPEYERHLKNLTQEEMKTVNRLLDKLRG